MNANIRQILARSARARRLTSNPIRRVRSSPRRRSRQSVWNSHQRLRRRISGRGLKTCIGARLGAFRLGRHRRQWKPLVVLYRTRNIRPSRSLPVLHRRDWLRSARWRWAQMLPEMTIFVVLVRLLAPCYCLFLLSAFCHLAFSSSWVAHMHGRRRVPGPDW